MMSFVTFLSSATSFLATGMPDTSSAWAMIVVAGVVLLIVLVLGGRVTLGACGVRFIPNDRFGIVEKLWSGKGSIGKGRILAINGEAGYEAHLLRGGIHFRKWS